MFRKIISFTTLWSFIGMTFTGIVLFIVPEGRVAYWADLHIVGLTKDKWGDLHTTLSALFMVAGILHTYLNWSAIVNYFRSKAKKLVIFTPSFTISTLIFAIFVVGTYYKVSPFKDLLTFSDYVKDHWREKVGNPPYPHAELSKLRDLARKEGLDINVVVQILKDNNVNFTSDEEKFLDIARRNKTSPANLYDLIESKYDEYEEKLSKKEEDRTKEENKIIEKGEKSPKNIQAPSGLGKMKLSEVCKKYKIDIKEALAILKKEGFNAKEDMTMKEIAEQKSLVPIDVFEILTKNKK